MGLKYNVMKYRLYILVLLAFVPLMLLRDVTPNNELRYLSITDEAIRNGTLFAFTNHGVPYADKPPLYFWLLMAGKALFGRHCVWFLSLFSLVPAFVTAFTMGRWTAGESGERLARTGELLLLTCGLFAGMAVFLRMDMLMCMFITLSVRTFYDLVDGRGNVRLKRALFPLYLFLALFSKGPLGLLLPLAGTVTFLFATRRGRTLWRYWGFTTWAVLAVLSAAWFLAAYLEGGSSYLHNLLFHQTVDRAVDSFHHKEPFYYYLVAYWYSFVPWSLLLVYVIVDGLRRKAALSDMQKLLLSMVCASLVVLSAVSSKIQVYLLPVFPFAVFLASSMLGGVRRGRLLMLSLAVPAVAFALGLPFAAWGAVHGMPYMDNVWAVLAGAALSVGGVFAVFRLRAGRTVTDVVRPLGVGMLAGVFFMGFSFPSINRLLGFGELCGEARRAAVRQHTERYFTFGIGRLENMDVYLGMSVTPVDEAGLDTLTGTHGVLMVDTTAAGKLPPAIRRLGMRTVGRYGVVVIK